MTSAAAPRLIALLSLVVIAACGGSDARLNKLTVGISRDSAVTVMFDRAERVDPYLVSGHLIEAMYFAKPGADSAGSATERLSPVVIVDGVLAGWGWTQWDSIAAANKIAVPK